MAYPFPRWTFGRGERVFGMRPETLRVDPPGEGCRDALPSACGSTGESVLVTVRAGANRTTARACRYTDLDIDERIGSRVGETHVRPFERGSEARIDLPGNPS